MKRSILLPLAALAVSTLGLGVAAVSAKPVTYELPDETAAFKPGPNLETVQGNCGACHSADYIAHAAAGPGLQEGLLGSRGHQDDQGLRRADRRGRRAQDRRLPDARPTDAPHGATAFAHFSDQRCSGRKSRSSSCPSDVRR